MSSLAEMEKQKDCHPEGVSAVLRELADRRSGGRGERAARQESCAGSEVLSGRGQQVGAGRSGAARHLADAARCGRASSCLRDAGPVSAWELDCWRRARWESPPPIAISRARMGSRDAKCYLASPEVVAASAVAGYIRGPLQGGGPHAVTRSYEEFRRRRRRGESRHPSRLPGAGARTTGVSAARQREHGCHLREGLHLPRRHHCWRRWRRS